MNEARDNRDENRRAGPAVAAGLCGTCCHCKVVKNARGSAFYLCRKSETDPAYAKYPRLPVLKCNGFKPVD